MPQRSKTIYSYIESVFNLYLRFFLKWKRTQIKIETLLYMCASWKQSHAVSSFHRLWLQLYIFYPGQYLRVIVWCTTYGVLEGFRHINKDIREVKHHVYVKWQTRIYTMWPSFLFTCRLLFIISTPKLVVSRIFYP